MGGTVTRESFGTMADGTMVEAVVLQNGRGMRARVITLGARLQSLFLPDASAGAVDVVLGYATLADYLDCPHYMGATIGRVANRLAHGRLQLDGRSYEIAVNQPPHSLHGGTVGFDRAIWRIVDMRSSPQASVTLHMVSADGDQGYPGRLEVTATYRLTEQMELIVDYQATTDQPTVINLTHHSYWNLAGEGSGSALDHRLTVPADAITVVDPSLAPTGELRLVSHSAFDFRHGRRIGQDIHDWNEPLLRYGQGYDLNWVISPAKASAPRLMATLSDPSSGRSLSVLALEPGLQFYSGNFLGGDRVGKSGHAYRPHDGVALEPQLFPDTPNQPGFGSAQLCPGQRYRNLIVHRFRAG